MVKTHHVQRMGESAWTDCGVPASNNGNVISENMDIVTCKKCLKNKFVNHAVRETGGKDGI